MLTRTRTALAALLTLTLIATAAAQGTVRLWSNKNSATFSGNGDTVVLDTSFLASLRMDIVGSMTGTVTVGCSLDNGTTYTAIPLNGPSPATTTDTDGAVTVVGQYTAAIAGCQKVRAIASGWSAGTPTVYLLATSSGGSSGGGGGGSTTVASDGTTGAAVPASANYTGINIAGNLTGVTGIAAGATVKAATVAIVDSSGNQISTFGGSGGTAVNEDVASADAQPGTPAYTVRNSTLTGATSTDGDYQPLKSTNAGAAYIAPTFADVVASTGTGASGAQTQRVVTATDSTIGTVTTVSTVTNLSQFGAAAINLGAGTTGTGTLRVTLPTDGTGVLGSIGSITSAIVPGTGATNLGKAIDNAVGATDTGVPALFQRFDTPTTLTPATGDYIIPRADSLGRVWVNCATGCSGAGITDNAAFTAGSGTINAIGGIFDDVASATATENSAAIVRITANKALHVNLRDASGNALTPSTDQTLDAALTTTGPLMVGRGSTATPTAMSTDGDATALWMDLNGRVHLAVEGIEDVAETAAAPLAMAGSVRRDVLASSAGTTGDNATINTTSNGAVWVAQPDPCSFGTKVFVNINQTTGTQLFTGTASNKTYVCAIHLVSATAQNIALVSGTGTVCATGIGGMAGGTTAATGWNLAANGGLVIAGGNGAIAKSNANADNVCLLQSSTGQISGNIVYVVAP